MKNRALLEMSVETLEAAVAAARGGADRIELCENLSVGGVTPRRVLMDQARIRIGLPIYAMIRPRGGNFHYNDAEFAQMKSDVVLARETCMDGIVLGILDARGRVDVARTRELIELALPLPATFHRAFDEVPELVDGLEAVIRSGASRVLTSGGKATADEGYREIAGLVRQAGERIIILPGGGIRPVNLSRIARETRASEFHSGLTNLLPEPERAHQRFEDGVRELIRVLEEESSNLLPASSGD